MREIVQDWVNGAPNYGFLIKVHVEEGARSYISFRSREIVAYNPGEEPNLRVNYVPPPKLFITQNGSSISSLEIPVCTEFTYNLTISDIPDGYGMTGFDLGVSWNSSLMELLEFVEVGEEEARPWDSYAIIYYDRVEYHGEGASWNETAVWASLTFHCKGPGSSKVNFYSLEESINLSDGEETYYLTPVPYQVNCSQLYIPVGGFVQPTSIRNISLPYITLIILIGVLSTVFAIRKYHISHPY